MINTKADRFVNLTTAGKSDIGGSNMNIISKLLRSFDNKDSIRQDNREAESNTGDYGYALYQSLEYRFKHSKSNDFGFGENLLNTVIR